MIWSTVFSSSVRSVGSRLECVGAPDTGSEGKTSTVVPVVVVAVVAMGSARVGSVVGTGVLSVSVRAYVSVVTMPWGN